MSQPPAVTLHNRTMGDFRGILSTVTRPRRSKSASARRFVSRGTPSTANAPLVSLTGEPLRFQSMWSKYNASR